MNRYAIAIPLLVVLMLASSLAVAGDREGARKLTGTAQERHAQRIFDGVFAQCRVDTDKDVKGLVALVFEVKKTGRFEVTATFREDDGRDELRSLVRCMGDRARQARPFPDGSETRLLGVKYEVYAESNKLLLGAGLADTISGSDVFVWARQPLGGAGS